LHERLADVVPFAVLREAINMRNAYAIYRTLAAYVEAADEAYGGGKEDPSIDQDFRSGVFLGNGLISLILSLLPAAVLKIMTVFGFTGDRDYALATLMKAGKWQVGVKEPGMDPEKEGVRVPSELAPFTALRARARELILLLCVVCDMFLLMHHLVISNYLPLSTLSLWRPSIRH
jgi:hypothetical protein